MIIVDSSVWIDHWRYGANGLDRALSVSQVLSHPLVIGELAMGNLPDRKSVLGILGRLPRADISNHSEIMALIERAKIYGRGLGFIDAHLLASARLSRSTLWTRDLRLDQAAADLNVAYRPSTPA